MSQEDPTADALAGDAHVTSADGGSAASPDTLSLADLNSFLGKDFKDKDSALKALKDTQSYVGKRKEDIAAEVLANAKPAPQDSTPRLESELKSLNDRLFYSENPQFKGYEALISRMGGDPAEVVASKEFQSVFDKVKVADEVAQKQSVVHSSPRLAQAKSVTDEAVQVANARGATGDDVAAVLAKGILSAER